MIEMNNRTNRKIKIKLKSLVVVITVAKLKEYIWYFDTLKVG